MQNIKTLLNFNSNTLFSSSTEEPDKSSVDSQITDLFSRLFPNLWIMLATLISLLILLVVLTYFVYKPTKKMIQKRKDFIQKNIDAANESREKSLELEKAKNKELTESRISAAEIVHKARIESEKLVLVYTNSAKEESKKIIDKAQQSIQMQQKKFKQESKKEIMDVAIQIAGKILEQKISPKDEQKILTKFLKEE